MDYLGYDHNYFALGKSVFDSSSEGYAINYVDGLYQLIQNEYSFVLDSISNNTLYKFGSDSLLRKNLAGKDTVTEKKMELKLKSVVQNFNHALLLNQMK